MLRFTWHVKLHQKSFESIAEFFKKKHTTMLYSYEKIRDDLKTNKDLDQDIAVIRRT